MFHGIMRELENEMGNIEVHFCKKKKKNLKGDFLILNILIVKGTYGQQ